MSFSKTFSVFELQQHWSAIDAAKEGDTFDFVYQHQMPPWNDLCAELGWQKFVVGAGHFPAKNFGFCGVYRVLALAEPGAIEKPVTLNRVSGQDTTGTLYVGHAGNLGERLNKFRRTFENNESSHNAAQLLKNGSLRGFSFSADTLALALLFTGLRTRSVEGDLIKAYMNTFGDAPPLNYRL